MRVCSNKLTLYLRTATSPQLALMSIVNMNYTKSENKSRSLALGLWPPALIF